VLVTIGPYRVSSVRPPLLPYQLSLPYPILMLGIVCVTVDRCELVGGSPLAVGLDGASWNGRSLDVRRVALPAGVMPTSPRFIAVASAGPGGFAALGRGASPLNSVVTMPRACRARGAAS